jgi:hypothetical protein
VCIWECPCKWAQKPPLLHRLRVFIGKSASVAYTCAEWSMIFSKNERHVSYGLLFLLGDIPTK